MFRKISEDLKKKEKKGKKVSKKPGFKAEEILERARLQPEKRVVDDPRAHKMVKKEPKKPKKPQWEYSKSSEPLIPRREESEKGPGFFSDEGLGTKGANLLMDQIRYNMETKRLEDMMGGMQQGMPQGMEGMGMQGQGMGQGMQGMGQGMQGQGMQGQGMGQGNSFMDPQQQQWLDMMTGQLNQMGASTDDPRMHQKLQMEYLDLLGGLQPQQQEPARMYDEAMEMVEMGQLIGDQDMVNEAQDILRSMYGMESMPQPGSPEYADEVLNDSLLQLFRDEFPAQSIDPETGMAGQMTPEHMQNLKLQLAAEGNPNLIREYMDADLGWWDKTFGSKEKQKKKKLEQAGFPAF